MQSIKTVNSMETILVDLVSRKDCIGLLAFSLSLLLLFRRVTPEGQRMADIFFEEEGHTRIHMYVAEIAVYRDYRVRFTLMYVTRKNRITLPANWTDNEKPNSLGSVFPLCSCRTEHKNVSEKHISAIWQSACLAFVKIAIRNSTRSREHVARIDNYYHWSS